MAIATTITIFDGQTYQIGEEIWDLGSFECIDVDGEIRQYVGLSIDVAKLPTYVGTGSMALCADTTDIYMFHAPTKTWYKQ